MKARSDGKSVRKRLRGARECGRGRQLWTLSVYNPPSVHYIPVELSGGVFASLENQLVGGSTYGSGGFYVVSPDPHGDIDSAYLHTNDFFHNILRSLLAAPLAGLVEVIEEALGAVIGEGGRNMTLSLFNREVHGHALGLELRGLALHIS